MRDHGGSVAAELWVKPAQQERSQQTLERFVEAAEALMREHDFEDISVQQIVQGANSSVGSFYARFETKDGFLSYLHERFHDMVLSTSDAFMQPDRWHGASLEQVVRGSMRLLVDAHVDYAGPMRAFTMRAGSDPAFREREEGMNQHLSENMTNLFLTYVDEIRHPRPEEAIDFVVVFVLGALLQRIFFGVNGPGRTAMTSDDWTEELTRVVMSYLTATA